MSHPCGTQRWLLVTGLVLLSLLLTCPSPSSARSMRQNTPTPSPGSACSGLHDLLVEQGRIHLHGNLVYDRICLANQGLIQADGDLSLTAGLVYIDATSRIVADGPAETGDCSANPLTPAGPGWALTIHANTAVIAGSLTANGLQGINYYTCGPSVDAGPGSSGGSISLITRALTLTAPLSATGGPGGDSVFEDAHSSHPSGDGGAGGHILIASATITSSMASLLHVDGGLPGQAGTGTAGHAGTVGSILLRSLTPQDLQQVPAVPTPLIRQVGRAPQSAPLRPATMLMRQMACGRHDLSVLALHTVILNGTVSYPHVCVAPGGVIHATRDLQLTAQTILVQPGGRIDADGATARSTEGLIAGDGYYQGRCTLDHSWPHDGTAGSPGAPQNMLDQYTRAAFPGLGGRRLVLIAQRIDIAGTVSSAGGAGQAGVTYETLGGDAGFLPFGPQGGGGGSGGGIVIDTFDLQLTGQLSVAGGPGGAGGFIHDYVSHDVVSAAGDRGSFGGSGCMKVFTTILRTPYLNNVATGPVVFGQRRPTDPSLPHAHLS